MLRCLVEQLVRVWHGTSHVHVHHLCVCKYIRHAFAGALQTLSAITVIWAVSLWQQAALCMCFDAHLT